MSDALPKAIDLDEVARQAAQPAQQQAVTDIGRMSAQAVLAMYDAAAKSVADMGEEVKVRIDTLEAALSECHTDMKLVKEAADAIREKGKLVHLQIEEASRVSSDIRAACEDFRRRIG
jgi:uncharacterized coiled-coil DUF342 family protein